MNGDNNVDTNDTQNAIEIDLLKAALASTTADLVAARESLAASEREAGGLMTELTALYKADTVAIDALSFYAKGWPAGVDGGNKARAAIDGVLALSKKTAPEAVAA
jgi:hypothetical protein